MNEETGRTCGLQLGVPEFADERSVHGLTVKAGIILVIEDNPYTRKIVRLTLGNEGFTVIEAGDGAEALVLASKTLPDLILQDLLLPDMDGFTLVSRLRAKPELVGVPIIAFSGFLSRLEHGRAAAAGFTDFMPKPIEPSRLVQAVRAHLPPDLETPEKIGKGRRVLVVDDDPVQLKLARVRLTGLGVVLTNVVMPGTSGPELTRQLVAERRTLRVIYMSGYTEEAIVQHGVLKPGIAFLNKPFTSQTLGEKIREVLER